MAYKKKRKDKRRGSRDGKERGTANGQRKAKSWCKEEKMWTEEMQKEEDVKKWRRLEDELHVANDKSKKIKKYKNL